MRGTSWTAVVSVVLLIGCADDGGASEEGSTGPSSSSGEPTSSGPGSGPGSESDSDSNSDSSSDSDSDSDSNTASGGTTQTTVSTSDTMPTSTDGSSTGQTGECFDAKLLWFEDFENGDYDRWTSDNYGADWGDDCDYNELSQEQAVSGSWSNRSEITCAIGESHRGYGGVQFDGDEVVEAYTNTGNGIEAPYGVVNTYWSWLETPYVFENGRWFSFWTVNNACDWSDNVITLGLENDTWRLTPAHIVNTGGTVEFVPDAPAFPLGQWVRTTIYMNYHEGRMHLWQDGAEVLDATFSRSDTDMCQWHWGAYASGDNDDVVLYEDDNYLWKLEEPWEDFSVEPWFDEMIPVCN